MALRPRKQKDTNTTDAGVSTKAESIGLNKPTIEPNVNYPIPDVRSFRDQAVMVINLLESQGINLYDETRTPGMYLNGGVQKRATNETIQKILNGGSSQDIAGKTSPVQPPASVVKHTEPVKEATSDIPKGLFDFLIKS
jgi:hypothetical protein